MPFYTLIQYFPSSMSGHNTTRYILITPDQADADILFRGYQESPNLGTFSLAGVSRSQPDIWVVRGSNTGGANFENSMGWVYDTKTFPTALSNENLSMKPLLQYFVSRTTAVSSCPLPPQPLVNAVNYGTFYIRNKQFPDQYWYVQSASGKKALTVSKDKCSKFRIRIPGKEDKSLVLVNYEEVVITYFDEDVDRTERPLYFNAISGHSSWLGPDTTAAAAKFKLGALRKGGFSNIHPPTSPSYVRYDGDENAGGDIWELV
ncbi:hypothetical protein BJX76DRAFT_362515 [Aspergillus varians]